MEDLRDPHQAERLAAVAHDAFHSRREFLQKTALAAGLTAGMGLALDPNTVVAEAAARQREHAIPSASNMPIDTFVVLMMENRSFDHYLGWMPNADGRQAGLSYTDDAGKSYDTHRLADFYQSCGFLDPDHSWEGGRTELDGGNMDGFLRSASDVFSIGYYDKPDLPFTPYNAEAFTVFDRFFCSILSSTYPNREYMHAAQSYGMVDNSLPFGVSTQVGFPDTTIFAALKNAGVSSQYYFVDIPVSALWGTAGLARSSQVQVFYEQAAAGTLPSLCFVDPSFAGEDQGVSGDEHPLADVRIGQAYMADVVHACMNSPQWKNMAIFCVYDEWGGFFDHVVPPRVPDIRANFDENKDFGQMGFRIPAILASPYARRGYVDHSIYGFESILKMIRYRFGIDTPLTTRDLYANNIASAFDFESDPDLSIPDLPVPASVIEASCPGTTPVDSGGTSIDDGSVLGTPILPTDERRGGRELILPATERMAQVSAERAAQERRSIPETLVQKDRERHDMYSMVATGYLERLGFDYKPATPATTFREPSKLGFKP